MKTAINPTDNVAFRLYAEDGFVVHAEVTVTSYVITVHSKREEPCLVKLPVYADRVVLHLYILDGEGAHAVQPLFICRGQEQLLDLREQLSAGQTALLRSVPIDQLETTVTPPTGIGSIATAWCWAHRHCCANAGSRNRNPKTADTN